MSYHSRKMPVIPDGAEKEVAALLLSLIHRHRGLVHFLETHAGINGSRITDNKEPFDLNEQKLARILLFTARFLGTDEFMADWTRLGREILKRSAGL